MKLNIVNVNGVILNLDNIVYVDQMKDAIYIVTLTVTLKWDATPEVQRFYNWYKAQTVMQFIDKETTNETFL